MKKTAVALCIVGLMASCSSPQPDSFDEKLKLLRAAFAEGRGVNPDNPKYAREFDKCLKSAYEAQKDIEMSKKALLVGTSLVMDICLAANGYPKKK